MATPLTTLEGIRPYLNRTAYTDFRLSFDNDGITRLFSEDGMLKRNPTDGLSHIRMFWRRNDHNEVTGIFLRVIREQRLLAWTNPSNDSGESTKNFVLLMNNQTMIMRDEGFHTWIGGSLNGSDTLLTSDPMNNPDDFVTPTCNIQIDRPTEVAAFFNNDREVLPQNIREQVFSPQPAPTQPTPAQRDYTWLYIGCALVLTITIAAIAKQYLSEIKHPKNH